MHYVIGDVHGCLYPLRRLVEEELAVTAADTLIFLGDYIGRGQNSKGVIEYILQLRRTNTVICLGGDYEFNFGMMLGMMNLESGALERGNSHAKQLVDSLRDQSRPTLLSYANRVLPARNVGGPAVLKYNIPKEHVDFLGDNLLPYYTADVTGRFFYCVHAGFRPGLTLENQPLIDMVGIAEEFYQNPWYIHDATIVFGHVPFKEIFRSPGKIGIDTGCSHGGKLTALCLEDGRVFQVEEASRITLLQ